MRKEQSVFRKGRSAINHYMILSHLVEKYMSSHGNGRYTAFIDLKSAFDSVPRDILWSKLYKSSINKRPLYLIKCLYQGTILCVRCGTEGNLTQPIQANKGVQQGCIIATTLFNLHLNDLLGWCLGTDIRHGSSVTLKNRR